MVDFYLAVISFFAALIFSLGGVGAAIILIPIIKSMDVLQKQPLLSAIKYKI